MKKWIALSAIGKDRPGIVAALSKVFYDHGCNLEDSSMTRLRGDFAVLLLVSLPENLGLSALQKELELRVPPRDLTVSLRELSREEMEQEFSAPFLFTLVVYGVDHPGIVYRISQTLADLRINITDLRTHVTQGGNAPLYSLVVEVEIPSPEALDGLRKALEELKKELKVEIALNPADSDEL